MPTPHGGRAAHRGRRSGDIEAALPGVPLMPSRSLAWTRKRLQSQHGFVAQRKCYGSVGHALDLTTLFGSLEPHPSLARN